jgi:DNA repair exonuclease SbcCD ATPase subunit
VESDQSSNKSLLTSKELNLSDLSSIEYQNKLIKDFLLRRLVGIPVSEELLEKIFNINEKYNQSIDKDKIIRNIRWKPKKFEFSNMFSYGENNVIDFTDMKGVIGVFAVNASGKSSILSALSFCIFDKCDRAFKASHVLNSQKMSFHCKFNFEIDNVNYYIERSGRADKKGNVKVDVKFWKEVDDKIVELNGEARRSTNDLIRDYLGTYDDFILTVLSIQNNKLGTFVDMGQTERKDLLSQFMGLNLFDELCVPATEKLKELETEIKFLQRNESTEDLRDVNTNLDIFTQKFKDLCFQKERLTEEKKSATDLVISLTEKIVKFDEEVSTDISGLRRKKVGLESSISSLGSDLITIESKISELKTELVSAESKMAVLRNSGVEASFELLCSLKKSLSSKKHEIDKIKIFVDGKLDKLRKLETHEYDPNCKYCVNNEFVKDALNARDSLVCDKVVVERLMTEYSDIESQVENLKYVEEDNRLYTKLLPAISSLEKSVSEKNKQLMTLQNKLVIDKNSLRDVDVMISRYLKQEASIESNLKIEAERKSLSSSITSKDRMIEEINRGISENSSKIELIRSEKEKREKNAELLKSLEFESQSYSHYISAVSRDGIPFELISQAVPIIEKEVNTILSQIVEFGVNIQTDGKNVVTNIVYSDKSWPLELASGLEKFLTSLVIRVALINISNLPRPNFIAIDEGFGCADADNLSSMNSLFSILKSSFDFMLIISHLDSMKDMVDHTIEIKKENGFSKITV